MSERKIERHRLSTLSLQSLSFAKKLANTSWLCMLETSVLRKLLEDNEAQKLHWFRKMNWNRKLIMFDAKFCRWNSRIFKRFLSLEYPSIHYCISREHSDFSSSTVQALILLSGYDGSVLDWSHNPSLPFFFYPWYSNTPIFVDSPYWLHL